MFGVKRNCGGWACLYVLWMALAACAPLHGQEFQLRSTLRAADTKLVTCVTPSSDGKTLVSGSEDGSIYVWDVATGRNTTLVRGGSTIGVMSISLSPDGKTLASGSSYMVKGIINLWDVAAAENKAVLKGHGRV